jgi:hypothetical protein
MVTWSQGESTVARLRLRGAAADPLAARLRIDRVLNEASLAPAALPPAAILCIRHLADPLPGSLALRGDASRATGAWTRAVASSVAALAEHAARPAVGAVPSDAAAIVFLDYAELLACLASDWCDGILASRWWWRSLFRGGDLQRLVPTVWRERAEYAPAAFEHLSRDTRLLPFVRKLDASDVAVLLDRVITAFGLPQLRVELTLLLKKDAIPPQRDVRGSVSPWTSRVPEASVPALRLDEQCLLGVSLMLQRAPAQARSPMFLQAVREWRRAQASIGGVVVETANASGATTRARTVAAAREQGVAVGDASDAVSARQLEAVAARSVRPGYELALSFPSSPRSGTGDRKSSTANHHNTIEATRATSDGAPPTAVATSRRRPAARDADALSAVPRNVVARPAEQRVVADTVHSAPAGPSVAPPLHKCDEPSVRSDRSPFGSAETEHAIAVATAGASALTTGALCAAPPVLPVATRFGGLFYLINAGIALELYGDFTSPARPGIALTIWDFVAAVGERLVGRRLRADPVWPMLATLAGREDGDEPGHEFSRFDRWLDHVMAYLRPRLALALRLTDRRAVGRVLLEHDARVFLTDSELHVVFSLVDLPIAVRLSGLDRNPGWVPAAGRRVAFEYE